MKKILCFILTLIISIALPAIALADVLVDGWQDASIEDLQAAQQDIANRISELRAAAASDVDRVELTGSGAAILSDVVIPFTPSRVIISSDGDFSAKLTGGAYDHSFSAKSYNEIFFDQQGTYGLLVEASGDWSFTVEPIIDGGTLPMSGTGPFVSDFFELPAPQIVKLEGDKGTMDALLSNFIVTMHHQFKNMDLWQADSLSNELVTGSSEPVSMDVILQPVDGRSQYCLSIKCEPGFEWSIAPQ